MVEEKVWRKAIAEIGSWGHVVNLITHGGGEPLLHPDLKSILTFARSFSSLETGFLTNGMLMDREWAEFVVSAGLDWICFSIDGVSAETHGMVRKGSDLDTIERNVTTLLEIKQNAKAEKPRVTLNMVAYDEVLYQQDLFLDRWIDRVDSVMISYYREPPDSKRWPTVPTPRKPCFLLWTQMVIAWDGRLGLCCEDFNIDYPLGRVGDGTLPDLWNGTYMSQLRGLHEKGEFKAHPMCRVCDTWADGIVTEAKDEVRGYRIRRKASQTEYSVL